MRKKALLRATPWWVLLLPVIYKQYKQMLLWLEEHTLPESYFFFTSFFFFPNMSANWKGPPVLILVPRPKCQDHLGPFDIVQYINDQRLLPKAKFDLNNLPVASTKLVFFPFNLAWKENTLNKDFSSYYFVSFTQFGTIFLVGDWKIFCYHLWPVVRTLVRFFWLGVQLCVCVCVCLVRFENHHWMNEKNIDRC